MVLTGSLQPYLPAFVTANRKLISYGFQHQLKALSISSSEISARLRRHSRTREEQGKSTMRRRGAALARSQLHDGCTRWLTESLLAEELRSRGWVMSLQDKPKWMKLLSFIDQQGVGCSVYSKLQISGCHGNGSFTRKTNGRTPWLDNFNFLLNFWTEPAVLPSETFEF